MEPLPTRGICGFSNRGEFAAEKRCGEFATLCDARAAVNLPEDPSGGELARNSFKNYFPPDSVRQFSAMRSEQILQRPGPQVANSPQPGGCKFPEPAPDLEPYNCLATAQPCSATAQPLFTTASLLLHHCFTRHVLSQFHNCKSRLPGRMTLSARL